MPYPVSYRGPSSQQDRVAAGAQRVVTPVAGTEAVLSAAEAAALRLARQSPAGRALASRLTLGLIAAEDTAAGLAAAEALAVVAAGVAAAVFVASLLWPRDGPQGPLSGAGGAMPGTLPDGWSSLYNCGPGNLPNGQVGICGAYFPVLKTSLNSGSTFWSTQLTDWDDSFPPNRLFWNATQAWGITKTGPGVELGAFYPRTFVDKKPGVIAFPIQISGWDFTLPDPLVSTDVMAPPVGFLPQWINLAVALPYGSDWGYYPPAIPFPDFDFGVRGGVPGVTTTYTPGVGVSHVPGVVGVRSPPKPWEREKKWNANEPVGKALIALAAGAQLQGHFDGIVRVLYSAIPGARGARSVGDKLKFIFHNFADIDWRWAALGLVQFEGRRRAAGIYYNTQVEAGAALVGERAAWGLARGANTVEGLSNHVRGYNQLARKRSKAHNSYVWRHRRRRRR